MAISFLKKGAKAQEALKAAELEAEKKANMPFKFFLKQDTDTVVTFLDGELNEDGFLELITYNQHTFQHNGNWVDYVCVSDEEPCPLCEASKPSTLVSIFSVFDHTVFTKKDGEVINGSIKLFIAKRATVKILQKIASKRGGLAGCTFDVSRTGEKSASVGTLFDYTEKEDVQDFMNKHKLKILDYENVLPYVPASDLRKVGFGSGIVSTGAPVHQAQAKTGNMNSSDHENDEGDAPFDPSTDL